MSTMHVPEDLDPEGVTYVLIPAYIPNSQLAEFASLATDGNNPPILVAAEKAMNQFISTGIDHDGGIELDTPQVYRHSGSI